MWYNRDMIALIALAAGFVVSAFAGAAWMLRRLERHRLVQAVASPAYQRAGQVQVLAGSPVARSQK